MFTKESEIIQAVEERHAKLQPLRDRFEADYSKWRLDPYNRGIDYKSVTSNKPQTLAELILDLLVRAKLQINIPIDKELSAERENIQNAERLIIGLLKLNNYRLQNLILPSLIQQLAWHSVIRGWYAIRAFINKSKEGNTKPQIDVWDIFTTDYDIGGDGLNWVNHTRTATKSAIKGEYDIDIKGDTGVINDFWEDTKNSVLIDKKFVKKPTKHGLDHIPCCIIAAGSTPFVESAKFTDTIKDVGESWLASNRGLVEPMNELYSDILTIVSRASKIPLKHIVSGGKSKLDKNPWALEKGQASIIPLDRDLGEDILPLLEPTTPRDAATIANIFGMLWQEGGVPESAYGQLGFQLSGYALHQLNEQISKAIGKGQTAIERGGDWLSRELLLQFSSGGFKKTKVEGRDNKEQYFQTELKPTDVKGDWFPEFRLTPRLPEDEMERWSMARIAHEGENPLWAARSINERILHVQDSDLEEERKTEEKGNLLPPILLRKIAAQFVKIGRTDLAQEIMNLLNQTQQPRPPSPNTPNSTGVSNSAMPAEMLGRRPPTTPQTTVEPVEARMARLGLVRGT